MLHTRVSRNSEQVIAAVCETLESRWLLATYVVPSGNTSAYLTNGNTPGEVFVRLDSPTATPVASNPFSATTGQHILDSGTNGTAQNPFLVVDRVWARWKPHDANANPEGIKVISTGGNATLRIESNNVGPNPNVPNDPGEFWDRDYVFFSSTSSDTRIDCHNFTMLGDFPGQTHIGAGVSSLIIRTNDVQASAHYSTQVPLPTNPGSRVTVQNLVAGVHLTVDTGAGTYDKITLGSSTGYVPTQATVITGAGQCIVNVRGITDNVSYALVDFGDGSGDGDNQLNVNEWSTVTLDQAPGTSQHIIVLEDANVTGGTIKPAILIVADQSTIDDLQVNGGQAIVLDSADDTVIPIFGVDEQGTASIQGESTIGWR